MSQYRAYPAYKDSGVEWIGQVPEHWEVKPICRVTSVNDDVLPDSTTDDTPIRYVDISSVGYMEGIKQASDMCFADAPSRARRKASSGDVIISTVRTYLKAVAAVTDEYADCVFSTGFAVLRARHLDRSFLKWMVLNELLIQAIEAHSEGLSYPAINASALVKLKSVIPPPEEQASIAATLDRETARIDALIEKKTRFIELLKEKRQALITHAVTKGLDPNVKMKDSGVEWIGQVPEHWKVARVKRLASLRNERRNDVSTDTIYIGLEDVEAGSGQYKPTNGSSRQSEDSTVGIFYEGDVLYGKLRPYLRKAIISEMAGCCSTEFLVLRAEKTEPRWLQEWLLTPDVTHQIESGCEGAKMPRADWGHIGSIEVVYPDQPEQAKILTSLDRETARIDALIEKKTRFIELLKEKRQALITHAVTKGLDRNAKMKDSGIEWIGQVPEHWEATKLKHVAAFSGGGTPSKENPDYWNGCIPWVSPKDMKHEVITDSIDHITTKGLENSATKLIDSGAVLLVARSGILRHTIPVGINNVPVSLNQDMKALSLDETRVRPRFILRWVQGLNRSLLGIWAKEGATVESLEHEYVANTRLPLPDLKEQDAILATLDLETARIDALISKSEQSIILFKERRAAFITAAVTGQIDLRGKQ